MKALRRSDQANPEKSARQSLLLRAEEEPNPLCVGLYSLCFSDNLPSSLQLCTGEVPSLQHGRKEADPAQGYHIGR